MPPVCPLPLKRMVTSGRSQLADSVNSPKVALNCNVPPGDTTLPSGNLQPVNTKPLLTRLPCGLGVIVAGVKNVCAAGTIPPVRPLPS